MKVAPFLDHHVDYFVLVLFVFVVLGLVFLVPSQEATNNVSEMIFFVSSGT